MNTKQHTVHMTEVQEKFVEAWAQMASSWGVSRTMAQIYALLYTESQPLDTDAIMQGLDISRGNANMNLHKLLDWGLVHKVDVPESRRDYFTAEKDAWSLTNQLLQERIALELEPVKTTLHELLTQLENSPDAHTPAAESFRENAHQMLLLISLAEKLSQLLAPLLQSRDLEGVQHWLAMLQEHLPNSSSGS